MRALLATLGGQFVTLLVVLGGCSAKEAAPLPGTSDATSSGGTTGGDGSASDTSSSSGGESTTGSATDAEAATATGGGNPDAPANDAPITSDAVSDSTSDAPAPCPPAQPTGGSSCVSDFQLCLYPDPTLVCTCERGHNGNLWDCFAPVPGACPASMPSNDDSCRAALDGSGTSYSGRFCPYGPGKACVCNSDSYWACDLAP
jgi:hypothetical protein